MAKVWDPTRRVSPARGKATPSILRPQTEGVRARPARGVARRRLLAAVVLLAAAVAGVWVGIAAMRDRPVHHFATVEPGVLYRSGQPNAAGWRRLRDQYGIRTVVDLRENLPEAAWAVTERRFCRDNGIELVKMSVGPDRLTDEEIERFVAIVSDPARQPVLVHCLHGSSRTGVVVAAYRIAAQGWPCQEAIEESRRFKKEMKPGYVASLRPLAERRDADGLADENGSTIDGR